MIFYIIVIIVVIVIIVKVIKAKNEARLDDLLCKAERGDAAAKAELIKLCKVPSYIAPQKIMDSLFRSKLKWLLRECDDPREEAVKILKALWSNSDVKSMAIFGHISGYVFPDAYDNISAIVSNTRSDVSANMMNYFSSRHSELKSAAKIDNLIYFLDGKQDSYLYSQIPNL